jgi:hypothetical protein
VLREVRIAGEQRRKSSQPFVELMQMQKIRFLDKLLQVRPFRRLRKLNGRSAGVRFPILTGRIQEVLGESICGPSELRQEELSGDLGPILPGDVRGHVVHSNAAVLSQCTEGHRHLSL